jgi:hypothetical protein
MRDDTDGQGLSDGEARAIARQLVRESRRPPDPNTAGALTARAGSQSQTDRDEDRIEAALVELGEVEPEQTATAARDDRPRE